MGKSENYIKNKLWYGITSKAFGCVQFTKTGSFGQGKEAFRLALNSYSYK